MNTFQLKRGILRLEGDRILISGNQARYVKLLHLLAAVCWGIFFALQGQKHYKTYLLTQELVQLAFTAGCAAIVLFWVYVGFSRGLKGAGADEIHVKQIVKAQKKMHADDEAPKVTLFLKNNQRRTLEFLDLDDLHFTDSLAGRGVLVVE
ncbi:hypothetical protein ACD591_08120 [Rufibacter glacialis]|uniref:Uncharacterized protein n=1 Tax=Rufibacter glacialis TaxID=1259555 RepID=A0A5M8Q9H1_9BACT|nr:hypothetical protein [Rufibacter glacialis]KAA6432585.1 hypothetical protein FOE74_15990 [Rufibacter glacialis]GGK80061.1 hypothetical protein GCM10011405_29790 [Rufibacter glacialis]